MFKLLRRIGHKIQAYYRVYVRGVDWYDEKPLPRCYRCGKPIKQLFPSEADGHDFHNKCFQTYKLLHGVKWPRE